MQQISADTYTRVHYIQQVTVHFGLCKLTVAGRNQAFTQQIHGNEVFYSGNYQSAQDTGRIGVLTEERRKLRRQVSGGLGRHFPCNRPCLTTHILDLQTQLKEASRSGVPSRSDSSRIEELTGEMRKLQQQISGG